MLSIKQNTYMTAKYMAVGRCVKRRKRPSKQILVKDNKS